MNLKGRSKGQEVGRQPMLAGGEAVPLPNGNVHRRDTNDV